MELDSFLDSTIELFRASGGTSNSWGFRVLTLVSGRSPALYESPTTYENKDWALAAAKVHALRAKVENTETVPAFAAWWDVEDTILAQNDCMFAILGPTTSESAKHLFWENTRSQIKELLANSSNSTVTVPVTFVSQGALIQADLNVTRFLINGMTYSYEVLTACRRLRPVEAFDIGVQLFP